MLRLRQGVYLHIHDVFLPGDYPEPWVMDGWGWKRELARTMFLSYNSSFEIVWGSQYMTQRRAESILRAFPEQARYADRGGTALWLRRRR